jgi:hypothetical protein
MKTKKKVDEQRGGKYRRIRLVRRGIKYAKCVRPDLAAEWGPMPPWYLDQVFAYAPGEEIREFCRLTKEWLKNRGEGNNRAKRLRDDVDCLFASMERAAPRRWREGLFVVAIDPSIRVTGYSVMYSARKRKDGSRRFKLIRSGLICPVLRPWYKLASWGKWDVVYDRIDVVTKGATPRILPPSNGLVVAVVEQPVVMLGSRRGKAAANSGDLVCLAACAASVRQHARNCGAFTKMVPVQQWKGNLPKAITRRRMQREWAIPKDMDHNEVDAIGLGDWAIRRFFAPAAPHPLGMWRPSRYTQAMLEAPPNWLDDVRALPEGSAMPEPHPYYLARPCAAKSSLLKLPGRPYPGRGPDGRGKPLPPLPFGIER